MKSSYSGVRFWVDPRSGESLPHPRYRDWLRDQTPAKQFFEKRIWLRDNDKGNGIRRPEDDLSNVRHRLRQYFG